LHIYVILLDLLHVKGNKKLVYYKEISATVEEPLSSNLNLKKKKYPYNKISGS
jgi:hypothetical protein